jgi:glycosyltransferase involved in cell wall biosynthesis
VFFPLLLQMSAKVFKSMQRPLVSFVVPCYRLAHFLPECVNSILSQTYEHLEVLIMDDCSPDETPSVARTFRDRRVRHIRNETNLGHLRNYNKGIQLSKGQFVWLMSADDKLRKAYALERYVHLMSANPEAGYVFCPAIGLRDQMETELLDSYYYGDKDRIFEGPQFISTVLRNGGGLASPSVMVRRQCYEQIAMFPLDMPHQGDMYLWFAWALERKVAYISEPLVNYRSHSLNMMQDLLARVPETVFADEAAVLWRTKWRCEEKKLVCLAAEIEDFISNKYARAVASGLYGENSSVQRLSIAECENAIHAFTISSAERRRILGKFYGRLADRHFRHEAFRKARHGYVQALAHGCRNSKILLKLMLATMGRPGAYVRELATGISMAGSDRTA